MKFVCKLLDRKDHTENMQKNEVSIKTRASMIFEFHTDIDSRIHIQMCINFMESLVEKMTSENSYKSI